MKARELENLTLEELQKKLKESRQELFNLRFQLSTGQLKNYSRIKIVKRDIARILTAMKLKESEAVSENKGGNN